MVRTLATIGKLDSAHQSESFRRFRPLDGEMVEEIRRAVGSICDSQGGASLLRSSGDVYIKPNGIDAKPYAFTRPEVVETVVRYWQDAGARQVYLIENSTQANCTRLVFEAAGYRGLCRRTGATPVYLDEEPTEPFPAGGREPVSESNPQGYDGSVLDLPRSVAEALIRRRDENLYINLPKLKTHSMTAVTLGIKNQWGFPAHACRSVDHNYNLHHKLTDVLSLVRPDLTIIVGVEGTIHGHYPATALADRCVKPFRLLIGSRNVVAADLAGARVFGLGPNQIAHLRLAIEAGLGDGVGGVEDIRLTGDLDCWGELERWVETPEGGCHPSDLVDSFPTDVPVFRGRERACREGCVNNTMTLLQVLHLDHGARGGWQVVLGKGHDPEELDRLPGPVLLAGRCAVAEGAERLVERLGRRRVYLSGECNDLRSTAEAMLHLTGINPVKLSRLGPLKAVSLFLAARIKGSRARVPNPLCHLWKMV